MARMVKPEIIPASWTDKGQFITKMTPTGLNVILSIEQFDERDKDAPPMGVGEYVHISLSRQDRYPEWDEMRDFCYGTGFFDHSRDLVMILPPKKDYVNVHTNCFHFYQKRKGSR